MVFGKSYLFNCRSFHSIKSYFSLFCKQVLANFSRACRTYFNNIFTNRFLYNGEYFSKIWNKIKNRIINVKPCYKNVIFRVKLQNSTGVLSPDLILALLELNGFNRLRRHPHLQGSGILPSPTSEPKSFFLVRVKRHPCKNVVFPWDALAHSRNCGVFIAIFILMQ